MRNYVTGEIVIQILNKWKWITANKIIPLRLEMSTVQIFPGRPVDISGELAKEVHA